MDLCEIDGDSYAVKQIAIWKPVGWDSQFVMGVGFDSRFLLALYRFLRPITYISQVTGILKVTPNCLWSRVSGTSIYELRSSVGSMSSEPTTML